MTRSIKATDQRESPIVYFDIELDDMGLTVYEYRAYGRIARRASGGKRSCTESLDSMAAGCQMSRRSLINAVKGLIDRRMIARESKLGDTSTYYLTDKSSWLPGASGAHHTHAPYAQGVVQEVPTRGASGAQGVVHHVPTKNTNKNTQKNTREESVVISPTAISAKPLTQQTEDAVSIALTYFPTMGIWQQELIANADINHLALWRQTMQIWSDHKWSKGNIHGMIDKYHHLETQAIKHKEYHNGQNQQHRPIRESHNERAARESLELIRQLRQEGSNDRPDPADSIFELPAAFRG